MHLSAPLHPDAYPQITLRVPGVRLRFHQTVPLDEVAETLELSRLAAQSLFGSERVALELRCRLDHAARTLWIDTTNTVGRSMAIVFLGYAKREFGDQAVEVTCSEGVAP